MHGIIIVLLVAISFLAFVPGGKFLKDFHQRLRRTAPAKRPFVRAVADLVKFARIIAPVAIIATIMVAPVKQIMILAEIVAVGLWWEFSVLVLLPLYRAGHFLVHGQAETRHEAWGAGKLRHLQPQTREELLSGLANQRRVNDRLARA